ncbi:MAG: hypothetical protein CND43_01675 [Flavobacteriales bacterium MED-G15]|nr:MAG: hypothetical protein CND43_01675 [Flavobacteriales bacterium MED-G15]|tara:strand:- start:28054 stop:28326 length:273 start_codon:yes stop_codon:yes gene_type:complete
MIKKLLLFVIFIITLIVIFISKKNNEIGMADACLCTKILSEDNFIEEQNKMPSVKNCLKSFEDFENAHLECIKTIPFEHPEITIDSLKSI